MFVILTYDVNQKRVGKILKICRKYLVHVQKSVFEGAMTEKKLKQLKGELERMIDFDDDGICIYTSSSPQNFTKEIIGKAENIRHII